MTILLLTNPVGDNKHELTINLFLFLMHIFENRFEKYIYSFTKKKTYRQKRTWRIYQVVSD